MPPKKRSCIGKITSGAMRMRMARATETILQRENRLEDLRNRASTSRSSETQDQREERLENLRILASTSRINESQAQREERLENVRILASTSRVNESQAQREERLENLRSRASNSRASETQDQREERLENLRSRASNSRASETQDQREERLEDLRSRASTSRQNISHSQRQHLPDTFISRFNFNRSAFAYDPNLNYHEHSKILIGKMELVCTYCNALKWKDEPLGMCCSNGKIKLPPLSPPPDPLNHLMSGSSPNSRHFLENIRKYNSCFQMTSFGATREIREGGFMPTFKVQGQIYHSIGSLLSLAEEDAKFLQIYFIGDATVEAQHRCSKVPSTRIEIVRDLQQFLHDNNDYVRLFKTALEHMPEDDYKVVIRADKTPQGQHVRRFNAPTFDEVAIVMVGNEFERRDIILQKRNNSLQRVAETHRSYDALQYPLIFWQGEDGYYFGIQKWNSSTGQPILGKKVSAMDFYAYRIMSRINEENHILKCRQLFHQFLVDMYAKIESERLNYIRLNQKSLRVEEYIHLRDAIQNDSDPNEFGKLMILPSSYIGSPRHMQEYMQDAMTYVKNYGRPDLFITFTCNPTWKEIKDHLLPGQTSADRHDLIARVFKRKLTRLINALTKLNIFGDILCWFYSIEWQKRGLPHAHILVWLREKIRPNEIDDIISAELPDFNNDPLLFEIITKNMIHGPCGNFNKKSPCMRDGKCSKKYPRKLIKETQTGQDGYPLYRRRKPEEGGFTSLLKMKIDNSFHEIEIDNRWVVPYNRLLSKMFNAHINVELCNSIKSIKYLCKYVNKGSDQAVFELQKKGPVLDEIQAYQLGRYISSNEAVWRILSFPIHERFPTVVHLTVHLENGQRVYFSPNNLFQQVNMPPKTTLTAFFELCQNDAFAKTLLYCEVPKYFTWNISRKTFERRKQGCVVENQPGIKASTALGRVYTVHPSNPECFFLRMLLHVIRGPCSFTDLKTVDEHICETFREACQRLGLLENDQHWDMTLNEAAVSKSPIRLRHLFAIILTSCAVSNPFQLWEKFKEFLCEDILLEIQRQNPSPPISYSEDIFNKGLVFLEDITLSMVGKTLESFSLPSPERNFGNNLLCREIIKETNYNQGQLRIYVSENEPLLVPDQLAAYNMILNLIKANKGALFFLDAPGGTGKTFLLNLILAKIREKNKIALAVASSGIAATLLTGGRTAHSAFKLPLNFHSDRPVCNISKSSGQAKVLQQCNLIIWDECSMAHKKALEALNITLQDLRSNKFLMGGTVVVLAGDFRQILPVIPRSTPADQLKACLKASNLWSKITRMTLSTNMRINLFRDNSAELFSNQLLNLGDGNFPIDPQTGLIQLPNGFCNFVKDVGELKAKVFPNIETNYKIHEWLCERAILAPKNENVNKLNIHLQNLLPGNTKNYKSFDTVLDPDQAVYYPVEFLNSLEPSGFPLHNLDLKIGSPIMLLRNLDSPKLCNGTRLCVKNLFPNVIEATILTGCGKGEDVFIPRIPLIPNDLPFEFKRLQFPIRLAFAMSINKAQGQSLKVAGINLENPCFSHGQLYVACSRVGNPKNLYILAPEGKTKNIVYPQALK